MIRPMLYFQANGAGPGKGHYWGAGVGWWLWGLAALPLAPVLVLGFFNDDFAFMDYWDATASAGLLAKVHPPGFEFFRPAGLLLQRVQYALFGMRPIWFHATSLVLLLLASALAGAAVALLAGRPAAGWAAAASCLYPARFEAVAWAAAVPDLLALAAVSASLLLLALPPEPLRLRRLVALFTLAFMAPLAKESALALPVVAVAWEALALLPPARPRTRVARIAAVVLGALAAVALRTAVLGGVGGYRHVSPLAWTRDLWAIPRHLFFVVFDPVNPTFGMASIVLGAACGLAAAAWLVSAVRQQRWRLLFGGLAATIAGLLPPLAYLDKPSPVLFHNRFLTIAGLGVVVLLSAGYSHSKRCRAALGSLLLAAWGGGMLLNLTAWFEASARRDVIMSTIEQATRESGRHVVWFGGRTEDYYRGTRMAGHLPAAVRRLLPGRAIIIDSEHIQSEEGRPIGPPSSVEGALVHAFRFDPLTGTTSSATDTSPVLK